MSTFNPSRANARIAWKYFDIWLFGGVIILNLYGVLMIRSAVSGVTAWESYPQTQIMWMVIGLGFAFFFTLVDYRYLATMHWYIYIGLLLLLIYLLVSGQECNFTRRCISVGSRFAFQPSEFGRVFILISLSQIIVTRRKYMARFSNTILTLLYMLIPASLVFLQPDFGMSILFVSIWFVINWLAGLRISHFVILFVLGILSLLVLYPNLQPYQQERFATFINPQNADEEDLYNIVQSEISVGSGGLFGKGYFQGTQSQLGYLRVQHTDFIFSVIVEEMGLFFGALPILFLEGFILWRILKISLSTHDLVGTLISSGVAFILFFQMFVNVGMNLQLVPVTGLTLPFVSYGGSSLLTLYIGIGIVQSVSLRQRKQAFG